MENIMTLNTRTVHTIKYRFGQAKNDEIINAPNDGCDGTLTDIITRYVGFLPHVRWILAPVRWLLAL